MTTLLILSAALGLIAIQPPLLRQWPRLDHYGWPRRRKRGSFADLMASKPEVKAKPKTALEVYHDALRSYNRALDGQLVSAYRLLDALKSDRAISAKPAAGDHPTEVWIDGTNGKVIAPPNKYAYAQRVSSEPGSVVSWNPINDMYGVEGRELSQLDMNARIAQHDQQLDMAWKAMEMGQQLDAPWLYDAGRDAYLPRLAHAQMDWDR